MFDKVLNTPLIVSKLPEKNRRYFKLFYEKKQAAYSRKNIFRAAAFQISLDEDFPSWLLKFECL